MPFPPRRIAFDAVLEGSMWSGWCITVTLCKKGAWLPSTMCARFFREAEAVKAMKELRQQLS